MSGFDFEKFKELYKKEMKKKESFNTEDFYKENEERVKRVENLKKTNKITIFSDDTYFNNNKNN